MTIALACPSCQGSLRVPEALLGKTVRCPKCQSRFVASAQGAAPLDSGITAKPAEPKSSLPAPRRSDRESRPEEEDDLPPAPLDDEEEDEDFEPRRRKKSSRQAARSAVAAPAICLMVVGGLGILVGLAYGGLSALGNSSAPRGVDNTAYQTGRLMGALCAIVFLCGWSGAILWGALQMHKLRAYGWAKASAILALIPCHGCWLIGIPFGIWALVALSNPKVKKAFR